MLYLFCILFCLLLTVFPFVNKDKFVLREFSLRETLPLRGLLAVCVMLTHLCPFLLEDAPLLGDFVLWGPPSVALFFLLAGYGLAFSYKVKGTSYLKGFFKRRLLRLFLPLLIMALVFQGYRIYGGNFDFITMLCEPVPKSWFIYALLVWYVVYYVSFKVGGGQRVCDCL